MSHVGSRLRAVGTFRAVSHLWLSGASGATAACHGTPQEAGDVLSPERWPWQVARATSLLAVRAPTERAAGLLPTVPVESQRPAEARPANLPLSGAPGRAARVACSVVRLPYGVVPDVGKARRQRSLRLPKLQRRMHMPMRKFLLPLVGMLLMMAAALIVTHRAEAATVSTAATDLRAAIGNTSAVEEVRCWRRRVCGPRGCAWRTTCRRW